MTNSNKLTSRINSDSNKYITDFYNCIEDLLTHEKVQRLSGFSQHLNTSRLEHSFNVSFYSFLICKKLGFDFRAAARAGLLHDLFLYDWRVETQPEGFHAFAHPKVALRNAGDIAVLSRIERDAILKHMWPLTVVPPRYKESVILSFVDKFCCIQEVTEQLIGRARVKFAVLSVIRAGGIFAK